MTVSNVLISGAIGGFLETETTKNGTLVGGFYLHYGEQEIVEVKLFGELIAKAVELGGGPVVVAGRLSETRWQDENDKWQGKSQIVADGLEGIDFGTSLNQVAASGEVAYVFDVREYQGRTTQQFALRYEERGYTRQVVVEQIGQLGFDVGDKVGVLGKIKHTAWKDKASGKPVSKHFIAASVIREVERVPEASDLTPVADFAQVDRSEELSF